MRRAVARAAQREAEAETMERDDEVEIERMVSFTLLLLHILLEEILMVVIARHLGCPTTQPTPAGDHSTRDGGCRARAAGRAAANRGAGTAAFGRGTANRRRPERPALWETRKPRPARTGYRWAG